MLINGQKVAPTEALNPGRTTFDMRQWYTAHNVSKFLVGGGATNVLAIQAAGGWQSMPGHQLSVRAVLKVKVGTQTISVPTHAAVEKNVGTWLSTQQGPITSANIYNGETYDATREMAGWATPTFAPSAAWSSPAQVTEFDMVTPTWQPMQPIRTLEVNPPIAMNKILLPTPSKPVYVYEFAQNAAGTGVYNLKGCPSGAVVELYYSEVLCGYGTSDDSSMTHPLRFFFVNSRTLMGCHRPPVVRREISAPHQCPLGVGSKLLPLPLYADARTF